MDEVDHVFAHGRPAYPVDEASVLKPCIFSLRKKRKKLIGIAKILFIIYSIKI